MDPGILFLRAKEEASDLASSAKLRLEPDRDGVRCCIREKGTLILELFIRWFRT